MERGEECCCVGEVLEDVVSAGVGIVRVDVRFYACPEVGEGEARENGRGEGRGGP